MRKTKIICTLGPAVDDPKILEELMKKGMDVARMNFLTVIAKNTRNGWKISRI